jgi:hypothetical protein
MRRSRTDGENTSTSCLMGKIRVLPSRLTTHERIQEAEIGEALKRMKGDKAMGPDGILIEVWRCLSERMVVWLTKLFNLIFRSNKMPEEWRRSILVPIFKNKGDVQSCTNYRGIKLMSHTIKLW